MSDTQEKETNRPHWARRVTQVVFMLLLGEFAFYGVFRCPFAVPYVSCGNCPVVQCPGRQWWIPIWVAVLASGLVMGRVFCGWACPAGFITDLLGMISCVKAKIGGVVERVLVKGKYIVLLLCVVAFFSWQNPRWAIPIRTGGFFNSVALTFEHASALWLWRTVAFTAAIVLGFALSHLWCRYLCPTGGVLELLGKIGLLRYSKTSSCNECGDCRQVCPVGTKPEEANCTNCGDCRPVCPTDAIVLASVMQTQAPNET
ncbi:MAG: 4Fe-4S binding protein [Phycisphaerales bacterium]|nr:MAG: 4Fe-4S binding protein [Phycisphaerales bacterium]